MPSVRLMPAGGTSLSFFSRAAEECSPGITADELSEMKDIAHGKWEIGVGQRYLGAQ